jgi:ribonuclease P protein component
MINRINRFHGRASIQRLYKTGKMVRSASLCLRYASNPRRRQYRLAVVVSRKVSKSAVVRNRIRRRLYESVRILSSTFSEPYDLVLVVYDDSFKDKPTEELQRDVVKLLKKAKLTTPVNPGHAIVEPKK